jgi:ribosomal protein L39E
MAHICGYEIVERILKVIKRNAVPDYNDKIVCITNHDEDNNKVIHDKMNIKERIAKLIKENEKYFIYEIMRTTTDAILHNDYLDMQRLKTLGYSHGIATEIFEKYGVFLYATDLSGYIYAPRAVKYELRVLIEEYGLDKVTEEIAIYLKDNYHNQFGINIVCTR